MLKQPPPPDLPGQTVDLGPIVCGPKAIEHTFRVRNPLPYPVAIKSESHSCSCTDVTVREPGSGVPAGLPRILQPGDELELFMRVDAGGTYARRRFTSVLAVDDPAHSTWSFDLLVETFPPARITPHQVVLGAFRDDGTPQEGTPTDAPTQSAWVEFFDDESGKDLPRPRLTDHPDGIAVALGDRPEVQTLRGCIRRVRYPLTIGIEPTHLVVGSFNRPVVIGAEGIADRPSCSVVWSVRGPLVAEPSQLHFGMLGGSDVSAERTVMLHATEHRPFRILAVTFESGDDGSMTVATTLPTAPATEHPLTLRLSASKVGRPGLAGAVLIRTDQSESVAARIPWAAFVRPPVSLTQIAQPNHQEVQP